ELGGRRRGAALAQLRLELLEVRAQHLQVERALRAEVVVAGREVDAGALRDLAHGRAVESLRCEQLAGSVQEPPPGLIGGAAGHERMFQTNVRKSQAVGGRVGSLGHGTCLW